MNYNTYIKYQIVTCNFSNHHMIDPKELTFQSPLNQDSPLNSQTILNLAWNASMVILVALVLVNNSSGVLFVPMKTTTLGLPSKSILDPLIFSCPVPSQMELSSVHSIWLSYSSQTISLQPSFQQVQFLKQLALIANQSLINQLRKVDLPELT